MLFNISRSPNPSPINYGVLPAFENPFLTTPSGKYLLTSGRHDFSRILIKTDATVRRFYTALRDRICIVVAFNNIVKTDVILFVRILSYDLSFEDENTRIKTLSKRIFNRLLLNSKNTECYQYYENRKFTCSYKTNILPINTNFWCKIKTDFF